MTRRVLEKLCTKKVCVDFLAPKRLLFHAGVLLTGQQGAGAACVLECVLETLACWGLCVRPSNPVSPYPLK